VERDKEVRKNVEGAKRLERRMDKMGRKWMEV